MPDAYRDHMHLPPKSLSHGGMVIACRLAQRFPRRIPTWQEIAGYIGCSRATAYRWRYAIQEARGEWEKAA